MDCFFPIMYHIIDLSDRTIKNKKVHNDLENFVYVPETIKAYGLAY